MFCKNNSSKKEEEKKIFFLKNAKRNLFFSQNEKQTALKTEFFFCLNCLIRILSNRDTFFFLNRSIFLAIETHTKEENDTMTTLDSSMT